MDKKTLMEFGLRALREQTPPIPKIRPSAPPRSAPPRPDVFDYSVNSKINNFVSKGERTRGSTPPSKASDTYFSTNRTTPDGETYTGPLRVY